MITQTTIPEFNTALTGISSRRVRQIQKDRGEDLCDLNVNGFGGDPRKFYGRDTWNTSREICQRLAQDHGIKNFTQVDEIMQLPDFAEIVDKAFTLKKPNQTAADKEGEKFLIELYTLFSSVLRPLVLIIEDYVKLVADEGSGDAAKKFIAELMDEGIDLGNGLKLSLGEDTFPVLRITDKNGHILETTIEDDNSGFHLEKRADTYSEIYMNYDRNNYQPESKLLTTAYIEFDEEFELVNCTEAIPDEVFHKTYIPLSFKVGGEVFSILKKYKDE